MNPELKKKMNQLAAMETILCSVMQKLGQLSQMTMSAPGTAEILNWQAQFYAQMESLREAIDREWQIEHLRSMIEQMQSMPMTEDDVEDDDVEDDDEEEEY